MTSVKYYGLVVGLLVISGGAVFGMQKGSVDPSTLNDNNVQACYLCTEDLDGTAVRLSENCQHMLHKACYDEIMANERTNKLCGLCRQPIVKPKVQPKKQPKLVPAKPKKLTSREAQLRSVRLRSLYTLALSKSFLAITQSHQLRSLKEQEQITQEQHDTIVNFAKEGNAQQLAPYVMKLRNSRS